MREYRVNTLRVWEPVAVEVERIHAGIVKDEWLNEHPDDNMRIREGQFGFVIEVRDYTAEPKILWDIIYKMAHAQPLTKRESNTIRKIEGITGRVL